MRNAAQYSESLYAQTKTTRLPLTAQEPPPKAGAKHLKTPPTYTGDPEISLTLPKRHERNRTKEAQQLTA